MGYSWIVIIALIAEVLVIATLISPDSVQKNIVSEKRFVESFYGVAYAKNANGFAEKMFRSVIVDSGVSKSVNRMFFRKTDNSLGEGIAQRWLKGRFDALWVMIYGAFHRVYVIGVSLMYALPLLVAVFVDALVERKKTLDERKITNSPFYHAAKRGIFAFAVGPAILLFAPISVHPSYVLIWAFILCGLFWVLFKNVQELS